MNFVSRQAGYARNFYENINDGVLKLEHRDGSWTEHFIQGGRTLGNKHFDVSKGTTRHFMYSQFDRMYRGRKLISHVTFSVCRETSRVGKAWNNEAELLDWKGVREQRFYRGGLQHEAFWYHSKTGKKGKIAYKLGRRQKVFELKYPTGNIALRIKCLTKKSRLDFGWKHDSFFNLKDLNGEFGRWDGIGRLIHQGPDTAYEISAWTIDSKLWIDVCLNNGQLIGEGIRAGEPCYFLENVQVSEKVYRTPFLELDPVDIITIDNIDLRSRMLREYKMENLFAKLKDRAVIIHNEGDMKLFHIQLPQMLGREENRRGDNVIALLSVICPTTSQEYILRVPPQATKCEQARQWTFLKDLDAKPEEYVVFTKET